MDIRTGTPSICETPTPFEMVGIATDGGFNSASRIALICGAGQGAGVGGAPALTNTTLLLYFSGVNSKQMKKWLEKQGATFEPGKGSHLKVFLNGKQSILPMHGTAELGKGLEAAIKRQLGLK